MITSSQYSYFIVFFVLLVFRGGKNRGSMDPAHGGGPWRGSIDQGPCFVLSQHWNYIVWLLVFSTGALFVSGSWSKFHLFLESASCLQDVNSLSLHSNRFLTFSRWRSNKQTKKWVSKGACLGWVNNWGEVGKGWARRGRRWGEKESPAVDPKDFTELCSPTNGEQ